MIFKAKWTWKNKEEIIQQLLHTAGLIEQGYPEGYGWSLTGEEVVSSEAENYDSEEGKFKEDLPEEIIEE